MSNATTGQGVGNATVTAVNVLTQTNVTGRTDGNGYYSLSGVGSGTVNLDWVAPGYVGEALVPDRAHVFDSRRLHHL